MGIPSFTPKPMKIFAVQYDGKDASKVKSLLGDACEITTSKNEQTVKVYCSPSIIKTMQNGDWAVSFPFAEFDVMSDYEFKTLFTPEVTANITFDKALYYLIMGHCVSRNAYIAPGKRIIICKQIPADIKGMLVTKLQSLPESVKDLLVEQPGTPEIQYHNQFLAIDLEDRTATSWTPTGEDLLADDWYLVR